MWAETTENTVGEVGAAALMVKELADAVRAEVVCLT
jgi:hypothetical protein